MKLLNHIRNFFFQRDLNRNLKAHTTIHDVINWDEVQNIGVLFDASQPENVVMTNHFAQKMSTEGKLVELLGFVNRSASNFQNFTWFNKKNLNWYYKPFGPDVDHFKEKKFDVLLNAFHGQCPPLEYIAHLSNARFRIGIYQEDKTDCHDLMINLDNGDGLDKFFQEANHFLKILKRDVQPV